jgi:hypothetical protein
VVEYAHWDADEGEVGQQRLETNWVSHSSHSKD